MEPAELNLQQIEDFAGTGLTIEQIAALLKIPKRTFERMQSNSEAIQEAIERGRAVALHKVATTAYVLAVSGECPAMTMFYLKTRGGWRETHRLEVADERKLTPEELKIMAREMLQIDE